jgi:hypothetical protein
MATATVKYVITTGQPTSYGSTDEETVTFSGTVVFSAAADTYATGGLLALAGFALANLGPYSDRTPLAVYIESAAASGYGYYYNVATKKIQIIAGGGSGVAAPVELTNNTALNAATPNIFTDVVKFQAVFPRV